jgi:hypothetical protein
MATVTKDFRIKSGLVVEGANGTINGSDILTEDSISGGTQNNITVTYNANTKALDFSVDALSIDAAGPLTYANNTLDLAIGLGLEIDGSNALAVEVNATGGLSLDPSQGLTINTDSSTIGINGSNQLEVQYGDGLTVESPFGLVIDLAQNSGLEFQQGTLAVNNGDGISITNGEVVVALAQVSGLEFQQGTLAINDGDGLAFDGTTGALEVNLAQDSGLEFLQGTLSMTAAAGNTGTFGNATTIPSITVDAKGRVTAVTESTISTTLTVEGDTGNAAVSLGSETLLFSGGEGIDVSVSALSNTQVGVTIAAEDATTSNKGIASFNTNNFTVTDGAVSSKSITLGSSTLEVGGNTSSLAGLTQLTVDNIQINGNEISSTDVNGNISLNPNANGVVDVNSSRITNLAAPDQSTDAATKAYVDSVAEGLHIHASAKAATVANINIATELEAGDVLDNVTLVAGDRVLVKNQNTASENGIYVVQASGAATRALDFDSPTEVDGGDFIFVTGGTVNGDTGWVQTSDTVATIGTDPIYFTQFSGAGTYTAGYGLNLDGTEFEIDDNVVVTHTDLDGYLNSNTGTEGTTILYVQEYVSNAIAIGDATATPTYLAVDVNSIAKQVAAEVSAATANVEVTAYSFDSTEYRAAKFLVKVARGSHTEVSEVLLTLDSSDNIAITEYAVVSTNGSSSTITADMNAGIVRLRVNPTYASSEIKVYGTLLI